MFYSAGQPAVEGWKFWVDVAPAAKLDITVSGQWPNGATPAIQTLKSELPDWASPAAVSFVSTFDSYQF